MEKVILTKKFLSDFAEKAKFIFESEEPKEQTEHLADIGLAFLNICSYAEFEKVCFDSADFFNQSNKLFSDSLIEEAQRNDVVSRRNTINIKKRYAK